MPAPSLLLIPVKAAKADDPAQPIQAGIDAGAKLYPACWFNFDAGYLVDLFNHAVLIAG